MGLTQKVRRQSQKLTHQREALIEYLAVGSAGVDKRSLFWGSVTAAALVGFLAERIAPSKNLPRKLMRVVGLVPFG